ncbi:LysR family transcriptional regulator [Aggregicoccus sp. 17bor-14]|uniref:LysR family transcriptional regulator n=1 Tax=Myxococcaceae TaxID=31 RepID=UPI00129CE55D|nr:MULTISPECIES: LysR substrate-binding domain-containing protein [Myxococcaceae]MBF5041809.1 LysR family transcriptional regulator [Simulacricoccus sp. 17bor-14]MRI87590.1 LysR family transcriptional regulator [Aggregicoccus sp. 17bor-14]
MELRHLRYFVAVARELSFTRAARRLHMAQPPLSQQIKDLEHELGSALFERAGRTVLLSEAGRELLPEALDILERVERLQERATRRARGEQGALSVALISSFATPRFAAMLRDFQRRHPGVLITLGDHPSSWQLEALGRGALDVGFLRPPRKPPANLRTHVLRREAMRLAVPQAHPLAKQPVAEWRALEGEPLILIESGASGDYYGAFFERCRHAGFEPSVRQTTHNVATQVWLVSAGLGIAPMPTTPDVERYPGVAFVDLPRDAPVGETAIAWRGSDESPALRRFVDFAREALSPR